MKQKTYDLEERLIDFTIMIADIVEKLPNNKLANHIGGQIIRSGSSPALNYGEAQEAETKRDFIHKMGICRKELRETKVSLKIILKRPYGDVLKDSEAALKECLELLAIFSKSIETARKNRY